MRSSLLRLSRVSVSNPTSSQHPSNSSRLAHLPSASTSTSTNSSNRAYEVSQELSDKQDKDGRKIVESEGNSSFNTSGSSTSTNNPKSKPTPTARANHPRCTADSSFASTSKNPFPFPPLPRHSRTRRPSTPLPPVPTASSVLLSSISESLPTTEKGLFELLRRIKSVHPSVPAEWFYQFHSQLSSSSSTNGTGRFDGGKDSSGEGIVSIRTWTFVLDLAFGENNLKFVEKVLEDIVREQEGLRVRENEGEDGMSEGERRRRAEWDRNLNRILLKGFRRVKRGDQDQGEKWQDVLRRLEQGEASTGGREWVVEGRSTKRISLGSKGKGKAKEIEEHGELWGGEGVGWRGWEVGARDLENAKKQQEATTNSTKMEQSTALRGYRKTKRRLLARPDPRTPSTTTTPRPRVLVPPRAEQLSSSSLSQLVQLLVQDQRNEEAFSLADSWLATNRPTLSSSLLPSTSSAVPAPSSELVAKTHRYNSTLLVLLNILLKPLLLAKSPLSTILDFPSLFISRHSPPKPLPQPLPSLSTIREILHGFKGKRNAWREGKKVVDHFGYKWGLPVGDKGFEAEEALRLKFEEPTCPRWRKYLHLGALEEANLSGKGRGREEGRIPMRPHRFVPPSVSIILLRHAINNQSDPLTRLDPLDVESFKGWWEFVTKSDCKSDWFQGSRARELVLKAGRVGLLDRDVAGAKRKTWYKERHRLYAWQRRQAALSKRKRMKEKDRGKKS
ncbi:hypothetical protein JCM16303_001156 [Sporobolomyces ruberrimus]